MQRTTIEYADYSWNPIKMLCTPISKGCDFCWSRRFAKRHAANPTFGERTRAAFTGGPPRLDIHELDAPLHLRKRTVIAVQFMGDLFHEEITEQQILQVSNVMLDCPQHTFLVLTKRPRRMSKWFSAEPGYKNPPRNIWAGVSVEDQATADERIPLLLHTPAAVRWVSVEPCLGAISMTMLHYQGMTNIDALRGMSGVPIPHADCAKLDWVVCGAETGPHKRPCNHEWVESLIDQCSAAGVPFFGKVGESGEAITPREMP